MGIPSLKCPMRGLHMLRLLVPYLSDGRTCDRFVFRKSSHVSDGFCKTILTHLFMPRITDENAGHTSNVNMDYQSKKSNGTKRQISQSSLLEFSVRFKQCNHLVGEITATISRHINHSCNYSPRARIIWRWMVMLSAKNIRKPHQSQFSEFEIHDAALRHVRATSARRAYYYLSQLYYYRHT